MTSIWGLVNGLLAGRWRWKSKQEARRKESVAAGSGARGQVRLPRRLRLAAPLPSSSFPSPRDLFRLIAASPNGQHEAIQKTRTSTVLDYAGRLMSLGIRVNCRRAKVEPGFSTNEESRIWGNRHDFRTASMKDILRLSSLLLFDLLFVFFLHCEY